MASIAPLDVDGDPRRRRPRRDRHRRRAFDARRPRRRGRGGRRRLPAVPGAHPRLPRIHADRVVEVSVRDAIGLTAAGIDDAPLTRRSRCGACNERLRPRHRPGNDQHQGVGARPAGADRRPPLRADADRLSPARDGSSNRATEIWRATIEAIDGCLAALPAGATIAAVGVSNQRETVLLWRRSTGETIGPCVTWQCRRSSDRIDALRTPAIEETVAPRPGSASIRCFPPPRSAGCSTPIREARALAERGDLCAGTVDSWLLFNLTGGRGPRDRREQRLAHATVRHPSRKTGATSCARCSTRRVGALPQRRGFRRQLSARRSRAVGSSAGVPVHAMMGDSHAALVRPRRALARRGQGDLRHRLLADDADRDADALPLGPLDDDRLAAFGQSRLRARGQHFRLRPGGRMDGGINGPARRRRADRAWRRRLRAIPRSASCRRSPASARRTGRIAPARR